MIGIRAEGHYQTILNKNMASATFGDGPVLHFDLVRCDECDVYGLNLQGTDFICPLPNDPESIEDAFLAIEHALLTFKIDWWDVMLDKDKDS